MDDVAKLGDLPEHVGYVLRRAQMAVFQDFIQSLADFDLRPAQFSVLSVIDASPGLRQTEVATLLGIQRTNFVTLFDSLERRGLAERKPSPEDRRSHSLYLTEAGRDYLRQVKGAVKAHEQRIATRLGDEDYTALKRILVRLLPEEGPQAGS
ncbi:MarR family winged helix-turn-helix transcriptional regulator [Novispirillum sp. DQ9]|uniref:MarR family winged helix-turn-helix transcriptional regulator n=1 Tax=Novispirillum sp. DQ9 TaxID=3398612 RepID=UPI003C7CE4C9